MKTLLLALPLAMLFANCRTTERISTTSTSGTSSSGDVMASTSTHTSNSRFAGYDISRYDPNNYMQNPEMYRTASELARTGGWTYNTAANKNTNFLAEALGEWLLQPTPEVAAFWIPDSSRADSYAAYWTPEAVAARNQEKMMAQAAYNDSVARVNNLNKSTASRKKGKTNSKSNSSWSTSGSGSSGRTATGGISANASDNSTTTSGGTSTSSADMNSQTMNTPQTVNNTKNYLMAVNGNMFQTPKLNLYLQNGTFTGFTGSNQLVGTLKVNGTQLRFDPTIPSTSIEATGGFSQAAFMERLSRVDSYDVTDGQLRLKQGNEVLFVLAKNAQ